MGFEIINELKKEKGYTNDTLAKISGVPKSTISKIASGITTNPTLDTLQALSKALGCTLDDFSDKKPTDAFDLISEEEKQIIDNYRSLNEEGQEKLLDYADDLVKSNKYKKCNSSELVEKDA